MWPSRRSAARNASDTFNVLRSSLGQEEGGLQLEGQKSQSMLLCMKLCHKLEIGVLKVQDVYPGSLFWKPNSCCHSPRAPASSSPGCNGPVHSVSCSNRGKEQHDKSPPHH